MKLKTLPAAKPTLLRHVDFVAIYWLPLRNKYVQSLLERCYTSLVLLLFSSACHFRLLFVSLSLSDVSRLSLNGAYIKCTVASYLISSGFAIGNSQTHSHLCKRKQIIV